jgi:holo-[acyl-carrier protein] synthase
MTETERSSPLILGIGSDLIEIGRVRDTIERFGDRFLHKVFTAGEIAYCSAKKQSAESYAARFAAKEAAAKALGTGISRGVAWREIEVRRSPGERPTIYLTGRAAERAQALNGGPIHLSLTHSRELAFATVLIERKSA